VLDLDSLEPFHRPGSPEMWIRLLDEGAKVLGGSAAEGFHLSAQLELLLPELTERLEHLEARPAAAPALAQQALVHQRRHPVQHVDRRSTLRLTDGLGGLQRAASHEHGETPAEPLLLLLNRS
jgi:hypothetical protein